MPPPPLITDGSKKPMSNRVKYFQRQHDVLVATDETMFHDKPQLKGKLGWEVSVEHLQGVPDFSHRVKKGMTPRWLGRAYLEPNFKTESEGSQSRSFELVTIT